MKHSLRQKSTQRSEKILSTLKLCFLAKSVIVILLKTDEKLIYI